jgi:hypothetical protein
MLLPFDNTLDPRFGSGSFGAKLKKPFSKNGSIDSFVIIYAKM